MPIVDRRRHPLWRLSLRWAFRLLFGLWSLALLAWLTLHWGILPRVDQWRPQIEAMTSRALGVPVRIGGLRAHSSGWVPALEIDNLVLLDSQGREALRLQRVVAALSARSLLVLEPRLAQLLVDGLSLDIRLDTEGRLHVGGLDMAGAQGRAAAEPALVDWVMRQRELVLRRAQVRWTDERSQAPPLSLSGVDAVLRNGARRHEFRLDATPPSDWGDRFTLRARFERGLLAAQGPWWQRDGEVFADLPRADLSQLRRHVSLPFELSEGRGALRVWLQWRQGRPVRTTTDLALGAVALRLRPDLPPLALRELSGRVEWSDEPGRWTLATEKLGFETDQGVRWQPSSLRVQLDRAGRDQPFGAGALRADRLDLATMARIATRLPLGATLHHWLHELAPQGSLEALVANWSGTLDAPTRYELQTQARGLSLAAGRAGAPDAQGHRAPGRPGLRGADIELNAHQGGGSARLTMRAGGLVFPGVFEQAELALDRLDGRLAWTIERGAGDAAPGISLQVQDLGFANADARGTLNASWRTGAGDGVGAGSRFPGVLDMSGRIERGQAAAVVRYLPTSVGRAARDYVGAAVRGGSVRDGRFDVKGDLWHFPFVGRPEGVFRIVAQAEDVELAYVPAADPALPPAWPAMSGVHGELVFDRASMAIRDARARVGELTLSQVRGGIADLDKERVLRMQGKVGGGLDGMLGFVAGSPVGGWLGGALATAQAGGPAELELALEVPLRTPEATTVRGTLALAGNRLRLRPDLPTLDQLQARIDFSERGLAWTGAKARALGGELTLDGGRGDGDGQLSIQVQGVAQTRDLLTGTELPVLAPLAPWAAHVDGRAAYRLQLGFGPGAASSLDLSSNLVGTALALPAPLAKPAAAAWPLRVRASSLASAPTLTRWSVELAPWFRLRAVVDQGARADPWRARAAIGASAAMPELPARGLAVNLTLPALDLDAWTETVAGGDWGGETGLSLSASLAVDQLGLGGRDFDAVRAAIRRQPATSGTARRGVWQIDLQAAQASGQLEWWDAGAGGERPRMRARFGRLDLPPPRGVAPSAVAAAAAPAAPNARDPLGAGLPEIDLGIDALAWKGRALGRLEMLARRGGASGWRLDRMRLHAADSTLDAQGQWSPERGMRLALRGQVNDAGRLAEKLGAGAALRDGRGSLDGELHWRDATLWPALGALGGRLDLALEEGSFTKAQPGAARLLGVLSLQALPRRLMLDFRDLFQDGFRYDKVSGQVDIERGVARTRNLRIVGVQAAVLIDGQADLAQETQDLRVVVVPEVGAGAASLAFAAVNPALALGSLLAQWVLREPILAASRREFHVSGSWSDPKVERIDGGAAPAPPGPAAAEAQGDPSAASPAPPQGAASQAAPASVAPSESPPPMAPPKMPAPSPAASAQAPVAPPGS